jgi:hypothetical protein
MAAASRCALLAPAVEGRHARTRPQVYKPSKLAWARSGLQPEAVVALEVEPEEPPATHKLILGDWIAQWDPTYTAWFFFNIKSGGRPTSSHPFASQRRAPG